MLRGWGFTLEKISTQSEKEQELQEVLKFSIEILWISQARNFK